MGWMRKNGQCCDSLTNTITDKCWVMEVTRQSSTTAEKGVAPTVQLQQAPSQLLVDDGSAQTVSKRLSVISADSVHVDIAELFGEGNVSSSAFCRCHRVMPSAPLFASSTIWQSSSSRNVVLQEFPTLFWPAVNPS